MALIPARAGSKGVPHKNIRKLGEHSLIGWSIAACNAASSICRTIVSTDSDEYARISREIGAEVPFLRPAEFSGDRSTDYDFIKHALDWFALNGGEPEYIVHIRPTTPFRSSKLIDQAVETFINNPDATALRSVHPMSESAYKTFEIASGGQLKRIASGSTELDVANNARQEFPSTYIANGYVDVLSTRFIRERQLIHGDHVLPFITPVVGEVDTEEDFSRLELELEKHPEFAERLFK
ncbi:MAG: acylneuraminate cytidylyltransferase family protein [Gammaproteobacteria bacterium]|nr:acylneuraminate cytidylyltransferase family protein [Gammaproteobacteria bacterium]